MIVSISILKKNAARNVMHRQGAETADIPFISILVAARNEETLLATCLESLIKQHYPPDRYEIVVVNDRSTDNTPLIIKDYMAKCKSIKCVNIDLNSSGLSGKQNAINEGLKVCTGEIILNTDADCIAGPLWVSRTASHFDSQVGLALGFSTAYSANKHKSLFADLQSLDMLLLVDTAAGCIGLGVPVGCLGRNMAYRKAVLNDISYPEIGYTITEDAVLIQTVARKTKWLISVIYDKEAVVLTAAEENVKQFLSQHIRWNLGGQMSSLLLKISLNLIFLFHLCILISIPFMFFVDYAIFIALFSILVKITADFIRSWLTCRELGLTNLLKVFLPYEAFVIYYSILIGFGSLFVRKILWKNELCGVKKR